MTKSSEDGHGTVPSVLPFKHHRGLHSAELDGFYSEEMSLQDLMCLSLSIGAISLIDWIISFRSTFDGVLSIPTNGKKKKCLKTGFSLGVLVWEVLTRTGDGWDEWVTVRMVG